MSNHLIYEYNYCIHDDGSIISFQLTFADQNGESKVMMPRVGPETGVCETKQFETRGAPDYIKIFTEGEYIAGFGVLFPDRSLGIIKLGKPTEGPSADINLDHHQSLAGFWGAYSDTYITELGLVVHDTICTETETVK